MRTPACSGSLSIRTYAPDRAARALDGHAAQNAPAPSRRLWWTPVGSLPPTPAGHRERDLGALIYHG